MTEQNLIEIYMRFKNLKKEALLEELCILTAKYTHLQNGLIILEELFNEREILDNKRSLIQKKLFSVIQEKVFPILDAKESLELQKEMTSLEKARRISNANRIKETKLRDERLKSEIRKIGRNHPHKWPSADHIAGLLNPQPDRFRTDSFYRKILRLNKEVQAEEKNCTSVLKHTK